MTADPHPRKAPAVVLLSGGLDSATTLAIAKDAGHACHALSFDYNQRHNHELRAARQVAEHLAAASHKVIPIDLRAFGGSALTDDTIPVPKHNDEARVDADTIPPTYVPARNLVFLSLAAAYAETINATDIFIGVNAIDYSGYPDCRPEFIDALNIAVNLATRQGVEGRPTTIHTPLINLTKAQIIQTGRDLGLDHSLTISCYDPDDHARACGRCDSCRLRKQGFHVAQLPDPTHYAPSHNP